MDATELVDFLGRHRASAILRTGSQAVAARAMDAAIRGGFRAVEFTLTTPGALDLIREYARRPDLAVGAGTVLRPADARAAVQAGAVYLVSPVTDEAVVREALELGVAMMPGTHTPSDMWRAYEAGAPLQKVFPAVAGGPAAVRAILAPMPFLRLVPTHGVDLDTAGAYLEAGAHAVGFVNPLFEPADLARGAWDAIEERAARMVAAVRAAAA